MKLTSKGDGTAAIENPHTYYPDDHFLSYAYIKFQKANPPLPIFKDGLPYKGVGEVEGEVVWQYQYFGNQWEFYRSEICLVGKKINSRQVYQVITSDGEEKKESELKAPKEFNFPSNKQEQINWFLVNVLRLFSTEQLQIICREVAYRSGLRVLTESQLVAFGKAVLELAAREAGVLYEEEISTGEKWPSTVVDRIGILSLSSRLPGLVKEFKAQ